VGVAGARKREFTVGRDVVGGVALRSLSSLAGGNTRSIAFGDTSVSLDANFDFLTRLRARVPTLELRWGVDGGSLHRLKSCGIRSGRSASARLTAMSCSAAPTGRRFYGVTVSGEFHAPRRHADRPSLQTMGSHAAVACSAATRSRRGKSAEHPRRCCCSATSPAGSSASLDHMSRDAGWS
jgi:hypothetical protein